MQGKKGLIMGIANDRSLAWGIAKAVHAHGAEVAVTYQGEALLKRVRPLAEQLGSDARPAGRRDRSRPAWTRCSPTLDRQWGRLDFLVHAVAFSDKEELKGRYINTSLENFQRTMLISCFSFTDLARRAEPLMTDGGSLLTLTYIGAEKVTPHYNVMGVAKAALEASVRYLAVDLGGKGIRVNAISAGPVQTLAASGIGDFRYILKWNEYNAPLKRNTTIEDVGGAGVYLLSDLGAGTTGEVLHVDFGYHVVGMKAVDAPDISDGLGLEGASLSLGLDQYRAASVHRSPPDMAGSSFGELFRFTTWGESHGPAIGVVVDGVPVAPAAGRGPRSSIGSTAASRASRSSPPSARSRTGSRSSRACSRA